MALIIDVHVHLFPDTLERIRPIVARGPLAGVLSQDKVQLIRKQARYWMKPVASSIHKTQTLVRVLPKAFRRGLDQLAGMAPLPSLLVESTAADLADALDEAEITYALAIAHPPYATNEFIFEASAADSRILPVVNIPAGTAKPGSLLKTYAAQGAKALKLHPASDGEGVDSPRYKALLKAAAELGLPVILHTGCIHANLIYKDPEQGRAERFSRWFETFKDTQFILAHMNFHDPLVALDLMEEYPNVNADTSWQPAEVIGEAVRRVGAERILFGSDWPLVGNNIKVGLNRIEECVESGLLNEAQSRLILGENAARLLKIEVQATSEPTETHAG